MYLHDFACHAQCTYACEKETRKSTEAIVRAGICHAGATVVSSNRMKYMPCFTAWFDRERCLFCMRFTIGINIANIKSIFV